MNNLATVNASVMAALTPAFTDGDMFVEGLPVFPIATMRGPAVRGNTKLNRAFGGVAGNPNELFISDNPASITSAQLEQSTLYSSLNERLSAH